MSDSLPAGPDPTASPDSVPAPAGASQGSGDAPPAAGGGDRPAETPAAAPAPAPPTVAPPPASAPEAVPAPAPARPLKLTVVIPCYNELKSIRNILDAVHKVNLPKEIIVVDDCSKDGTRDLLQGELRGRFDRLVLHEKNQGKGAALRTGFQHATGDLVIVQDADLEYDPQDWHKLYDLIAAGKADVVFGSRFASRENRPVLRYWHTMINRVLTRFSNMLSDLNLTDMETCYKMFRREIIQKIPLRENRFGFEPEVTAKVARLRVRIYEVPVSYYPRSWAEGKKIGLKDGFRALWCILKYNLWSR